MKVEYKFDDTRGEFPQSNSEYKEYYQIYLFYNYFDNKFKLDIKIYDTDMQFEKLNEYNLLSTSLINNIPYISYTMLNSESENYKQKIKEEIFTIFSNILNKKIELFKTDIEEINKKIQIFKKASDFSKNHIRNEKIKILKK